MIFRLLFLCMLLCHMDVYAADKASTKNTKTITIVADVWCPYNCRSDDDKKGFMIDIARTIFEKNGYEVEYRIMPWKEAIERTRNGEYNAIVGASTGDAPDFVFPDIEQGWMQNQFFVRSGNKWRYLGRDSLMQVKIGATAAYSYGPAVDPFIKRYESDPSRLLLATGDNVLADNVERLLSGKVDAILEDAYVMAYYLSQNKLTNKIEMAGRLPVSDINNVYIAFSPQKSASKRYADMLSEGMRELRRSGELQRILNNYSIQDWRR